MCSKAESINPPLHPAFPPSLEQSTSYYSEKRPSSPPLMAFKDSRDPIAEKAQQDPQDPWSLTAWTFPASTQLTSPTKEVSE